MNIRYPSITGQTDKEQLRQVKSYLHQLAEQLNVALARVELGDTQAAARESIGVQQAAGQDGNAQQSPAATFQSIKGLIIKSADIVQAYSKEIDDLLQLDAKYVAQSEYGEYTQETSAKVEANAESIKSVFENVQSITDATQGIEEVMAVRANIKAGMLDHAEDGTPVYGLEVGQRTEKNGVEVFNKYARFVSDRLSFYDQNENEVAYISDYKLYIRDIELLGKLKTGGYEMDNAVGLAFKWVGKE